MPRNLRKRGQTWWYRIRHQGQDHEGSLETDNLGQAKERLGRKRAELIATGWGEKPRRTFNDAAERFGEEHFANLKPASARRYVVSIANLLETFACVKLDEIGSAMLGDFARARKSAGVSGATIRRDLACLSSIFTLAEEWDGRTIEMANQRHQGRPPS